MKNDRMQEEPNEALNKTGGKALTCVLLFWVGYLAVTVGAGFATSITIASEVWRLTAWGLVSSAGLLALSRFLTRREQGPRTTLDPLVSRSSLRRFSIGLLLGVASFGVHLAIVTTFAGPIQFEWVPGVGAMAAAIYFVRFLSTSCMEELGFRGYALRRLTGNLGPWPAVLITALVFGLSHFLYGWDARTIALGVVPAGVLWGMSAIATRGVAVPIGLHAAWNFVNWSVGGRAETGLLHMVAEDEVLERLQVVGMASYLSIFAALTVAFWFVHRRNVQRAALPETSQGSKR